MPPSHPLAITLTEYKEAQLQEAIRSLCEVLHITMIHHWSEKHSAPGWPDCTFIVDEPAPYVFYAELKDEEGVVTTDQQYVIDNLRAAGHEVFIWRPHDWSEIVRKLRSIGVTNARHWKSSHEQRALRKARRAVR